MKDQDQRKIDMTSDQLGDVTQAASNDVASEFFYGLVGYVSWRRAERRGFLPGSSPTTRLSRRTIPRSKPVRFFNP